MNKISVVIPTYNRKEQLKILIQSLLPQKQFLEEIIIVDGSTDGTFEEIESLSEPLLNIYRIKNNSERGFARNYGSTRAHGSYINFLIVMIMLIPIIVKLPWI